MGYIRVKQRSIDSVSGPQSKGTMIAFVFVVGLFGGVVGKAIPGNADSEKTAFTFEETFSMAAKGFSAEWLSANEIMYMNRTTRDIMAYDFNKRRVFVEGSVLKKYKAVTYKFSPDKKYLLLGHSQKQVYRHSTTAKYVVYSLEYKTYTEVADNRDLSYVLWAPNSKRLVYVRNNNIYYTDLETKETYNVTSSGVPGIIFNGVADWAYEEEVIGSGGMIEISPDSQRLSYVSLNASDVAVNVFVEYGRPGCWDNQYAREVRIRYPKTGTNISTYNIYSFNFADGSTHLVSKYREGREIVHHHKWVTNSTLAVTYLNRVQNVTEVDLCSAKDGKCKMIVDDRNPKGWSVIQNPVFSSSGDRYVWRKLQPVGGVDYYHLHLIKTDGSKGVVLTNGTFMVERVRFWDEVNRIVYYSSSSPGKPSTSHIYAVPESGNESPVCVTCQLSTPDGVPCKWGDLFFGPEFKRVVGSCSGPGVPSHSSYINSADKKLKFVEYLEDNSELRDVMRKKLQPEVVDVQVTVADNIDADARLYLPPNLDTSGKTKYPMLIYVYGGPHNPQVKDKFTLDWSLYLTTNLSYVYAIIDGRGTGQKGADMMYAVYRSFGTVEIQDQITVAKYLQDKFKFIDSNRTGIWGWSYGGYATTKVLENDVGGVFRCGVAGAPVTDWMYYNSIYTERYMGLPSGNEKGYNESSTLHNVENLRTKKYLLIHGTGDDNVHYQHAMALASVLQNKKILFEQASYPDENHGFAGNSRIHMMYTVDNFFKRCFGLSR